MKARKGAVKVPHIWIVEMLDKGKWMPTVGCGLDKQGGIREMKYYWHHNCPDDQFRVRQYRAVTSNPRAARATTKGAE